MSVSNYPDEFYRGLSSGECVSKEGYVTAAAFLFQKSNSTSRNAKFCELSINWNDNDESLKILLNQHKPFNEEKQFKFGHVKISRKEMDKIFIRLIRDKIFSYERCPINADPLKDVSSNPYHGNLLIKEDIDVPLKKNIQHTLATLASNGLVLR